jgi:glycogen operon protein
VLPGREYGETFKPTLDTSTGDGSPANPGPLEPKSRVTVRSRSLLLLRAPRLAAEPPAETY